MATTDTTGNRSDNRTAVSERQLKEEQRRKKVAEMAAKADKGRRHRTEDLPFEPMPFLIRADNETDRYNIYHKEIGAFKRENLKGPAYKIHREEICLFMKRGKKKGADSKMAAHTLMQEASEACRKWMVENGGQDSMELLSIFEKMNSRWATEVGE